MLYLRLILCVASVLALSTESQATRDPFIRWKRLRTPHFEVLYDSRHKELAKEYARFSEQAYAATVPTFREAPTRTVVVLDDSTDIANGFATGVPYPLVTSFPVLPHPLDSISDYGNWGLELMTHEYTHILEFEPANGVFKPLRYVFGTILRPNMLLPRWYLEGLAVEIETRFSSYGRLRSANYLAIPRAMLEDGSIFREDIGRINEVGIPDWPGGMRPYLMGALLWNELVRREGEDVIYRLNNSYSRRMPYFLSGPVKSIFGVDWQQLLEETYTLYGARAQTQMDLIRAANETPAEALSEDGFFSHTPAISPDGSRLIYIAKTHNEDSTLRVRERGVDSTEPFSTLKDRKLFTTDNVQSVSWFPDSQRFVYDAVDTWKRWYSYADLYVYDFSTKKRKQITKGLRAREPVVSTDGTFIVFRQNTPGSTQLARVNADGSAPEVLYTPPIQTRISRPAFLNANEVVFSEKRDDGAEVLRVLDLTTREVREVLRPFLPAHYPRPTSAGLLFVSDRTGVANLYLASENLESARAVTNATTRLMTGEIDARTGDLYYSRLTSKGPLLHRTAAADWQNRLTQPPEVGSMVESEWPSYQPPETEITAVEEDYNPWPYLLPRYWMPFLFFVEGGTVFQAATSATDPLGKHAWSLTAMYDTLTGEPGVGAQYVNSTTPIEMAIGASDYYEYLYSSAVTRHNTSVGLMAGSYIPRLNNNWRIGLGGQYSQTELGRRNVVRLGPQVTLQYRNVSQRGEEISPEKGGAAQLTHTSYLPDIGTIDYDETVFRGAYYFSRGLPERHVLAGFFNASVAPRLSSTLLGTTTISGNYGGNLLSTAFIMRGYASGTFIGRNLLNATLEYRFPISYEYKAYGTSPLFLRRWHGAAFVDALTLDGLAYDYKDAAFRRQATGTYYYGTGMEFKADLTVGYHIPLTVILGLYYGLDQRTGNGGLSPFVGFSL